MNETVDFLGAKVIQEIIQRSNLDTALVDEVILGQAKQSADAIKFGTNSFIAVQDFLIEVPAYTVHRQCGSGVQSINNRSSANRFRL